MSTFIYESTQLNGYHFSLLNCLTKHDTEHTTTIRVSKFLGNLSMIVLGKPADINVLRLYESFQLSEVKP
jgi:hypothetical protein